MSAASADPAVPAGGTSSPPRPREPDPRGSRRRRGRPRGKVGGPTLAQQQLAVLTTWQAVWPKVQVLHKQMVVAFWAKDNRSLKRLAARLRPLVKALERVQRLAFEAWSIRDEIAIRRAARIDALNTPEAERERLRRVRSMRRDVLREIDEAEAAGLAFSARDLRQALETFLAHHGPRARKVPHGDPSGPTVSFEEHFRASWSPFALIAARFELKRRLKDLRQDEDARPDGDRSRNAARDQDRHESSRSRPHARFLQNEPDPKASPRQGDQNATATKERTHPDPAVLFPQDPDLVLRPGEDYIQWWLRTQTRKKVPSRPHTDPPPRFPP